jgi:4-amino-4-deoxy-L-arabinose transferase-like glycosyltransferase
MLRINKIAKRLNIKLLIVILIAILLRVIFLSTVPNGLYHDEATIGYDAYSFLRTGHSQYGEFLPLFSKAFSDYNESFSRFITVPFIWLFGLNEFSIRFPIAIIGVITVVIIYYLVKEISNKKIAFFSAFSLSISPWHIQFSRIAFTGILVPLFFCLGLLFFIKSLKKPNYLSLSAIAFGLSMYTYSPARVVVPIFLLGLVCVFRDYLKSIRKQTLIATVIFGAIFSILFNFWISPEGMTRVKSLGGLISNPIQIIYNYLSYFSPNFLFFSGDSNLRHSPPGIGELHFIELITVVLGVFGLVKNFNQKQKERNILLLWLLLYPIPAAFTAPGHALRAIIGVPLFSIFSGYGYSILADILKIRKKVFYGFTISVMVASIAWFANCYFLDYPTYSTHRNWRYGMKEAITYAENSSKSCIAVSNKFYYMNIFIAFYSQYDPLLYQRSPIEASFSSPDHPGYSLGKYNITPISNELVLNDQCLLMIKPDEIQDIVAAGYDWQESHTIRNPRGDAEIVILGINKY